MCRIAAYLGPDIPLEDIISKPVHSLLEQSQHAAEAKLAVNGDGFGIAWYGRRETPGVYRDVLPAWSDGNLTSLCRMVESGLFIAHIRASTMGETSRANCHPFSYGKWSFCHNGQVPHFPSIRRGLEAALPDELYAHRRGTTDSEMVFLTLLSNGLEEDPAGAVSRTIETVSAGATDGPVRLTCVFSDGQSLYAFRYASDGKCPTLYLTEKTEHGGQALASEPLCGGVRNWRSLPPGVLVRINGTDSSEHSLQMPALMV